MQQIIIKSKPAGKLIKCKKLYRRIKYLRTGQIIVCMSIIYEKIEWGSAELIKLTIA